MKRSENRPPNDGQPKSNQIPLPKLLVKLDEGASLLSICPRTLWALAKSGRIKRVCIGRAVRFDMDELKAFVSRSKGE